MKTKLRNSATMVYLCFVMGFIRAATLEQNTVNPKPKSSLKIPSEFKQHASQGAITEAKNTHLGQNSHVVNPGRVKAEQKESCDYVYETFLEGAARRLREFCKTKEDKKNKKQQ